MKKIKSRKKLQKNLKKRLNITILIIIIISLFSLENLVPTSLASFKSNAIGQGIINIAKPITEILIISTDKIITPYEPFDLYFNVNNFNDNDINMVTLKYQIEVSSNNKLPVDLKLYFINTDGTETLIDSDYTNILKQSEKETHKYHVIANWTNTENLDMSYANITNNIKIKTTNIQVINDN